MIWQFRQMAKDKKKHEEEEVQKFKNVSTPVKEDNNLSEKQETQNDLLGPDTNRKLVYEDRSP